MTAVFRICAIRLEELKSKLPRVSVARRAAMVGRAVGPRGRALLFVGLALAAPGCGSKSKAPAQPAAAVAEEKTDEPDVKPAAKVEKKPVEAKPPEPVARKVPQDPMKWQVADLQAGLSAQDARFVPAVMFFSMQNLNGQKQAQDLKALLVTAGRLKDDVSISMPLSPAPASASVTASKPVVPGSPVTPGQPPTGTGRKKRMGGAGFGGGLKSGS
jgi:hypothetical protein